MTRQTTFGPGSQFIILTRLAAVQADTVQTYSLRNVLDSKEWSKVEFDYCFFKIHRIAMVFLPRNLPTSYNQDSLYVNINYTAQPIEAPSIQDNTQMIPPYLPFPKTLIYRVPHVSVDGIVLNSWLDHGDFIDATEKIVFTLSSPDNAIGWNFRLELGVICRLPTNPTESKNNNKIIKQIINEENPDKYSKVGGVCQVEEVIKARKIERRNTW